jgi:prepilin-type N-terminal cleavage/methylation domain-containing protein
MKNPRQGFTLLELILVIGLMSVLTMLSFYEKQTDMEQARARQVGGILYQYNNAVRSALAQGLVPATTTKLGTDWLKNSTCGGVLAVGSELLPCSFPAATTLDPISFGRMSLSTAVVVSGTSPAKKYTATTLTSPFILVSTLGVADVRADLAGVASLSAAAAMTSGFQSGASGGLTPFTATTDSSYKADPLTGKITIVASNTANNDVWLRTDGGNQMHATLNFDATDPADRMIVGASTIQNFAGQVLRIGSGSGLTPVTGAGVVIDATAEVLGDFRVRRTLSVDNSLNVTGNITATGAIRAGTNLEANGSVVAQGNVTANGSVSAAGNVTANGALVSQVFYDANNMGYYVDPDATSNLNSLAANYISSNGRIRAGEFVEISGVANEGWGCSPNGLIGRTAAGGILSCQSGIWKAGGLTLGPTVLGGQTGYDVKDGGTVTYDVYCPAGTVMVGLRNIVWGDIFQLICQ